MFQKIAEVKTILRAKDARTLTLLNPKSGFTLMQNIIYSYKHTQNHSDIHPKKTLDIYIPKNNKNNKKQKVVIFWHGGRWTMGDKSHYGFIGQAFAAQGIITVVANYRVYPEVIFPACAHDAAECTAWVFDNIERYGGDPTQIYLMGHSSGAHLAVLISSSTLFLAPYAFSKKQIAGVIGIAGPYHFLPSKEPDIQAIFPEVYANMAQPVFHIDQDTPPMFLLWGAKDKTVYEKNIQDMAMQFKQQNIQNKIMIYPKLNHVNILMLLGKNFSGFGYLFGNVYQDILAFIALKKT